MPYRVCKTFEIESGHLLSKHPDRCQFPHGHNRRVELIFASDTLDDHDMVVDFKWIKLAVEDYLDQYDHALCVNASDPIRPLLEQTSRRVVVFEEGDPTTERLAERIFHHVTRQIAEKLTLTTPQGVSYRLTQTIRLERARVWETSSSWAEYGG